MMGPSNDNPWTVDLGFRELLVLLKKPTLKVHSNMAWIAQSVEHKSSKFEVAVSNPASGKVFKLCLGVQNEPKNIPMIVIKRELP